MAKKAQSYDEVATLVARLSLPEQLRLVQEIRSRVRGSKRRAVDDPAAVAARRAKAEALLAEFDAVAEELAGEYDAVKDIREIREERVSRL